MTLRTNNRNNQNSCTEKCPNQVFLKNCHTHTYDRKALPYANPQKEFWRGLHKMSSTEAFQDNLPNIVKCL
jgi:hypothetical protein